MLQKSWNTSFQLKGSVSGGQLPSFEGAGSQRANEPTSWPFFFALRVWPRRDRPSSKTATTRCGLWAPEGSELQLAIFHDERCTRQFLSNPVSLKILKACCTVYSWNPRHLVSNSYEVQLVSQDRWPEPKHCGCRFCIAGRGAICLSNLSAMATFEIWEYRWWLWNVGFQAAVAGNNTEVTCKQQCHVEMSDPTMPCHWIPDCDPIHQGRKPRVTLQDLLRKDEALRHNSIASATF